MEARSQAGGKADNPQVPTSEFGVRNVRYHPDERRASCSNRDIGLLCYAPRPPGRGPSSCLVPAIPLATGTWQCIRLGVGPRRPPGLLLVLVVLPVPTGGTVAA
jgi:hypothetical protein